MIDRERLEELAALQALGLLKPGDPDLATWVAEAGPEGEALVAELKLAAAALASAAPSVEPRPEMKRALMASLGPARAAAPAAPVEPARRRPVLAWVAAAAAVIALAVALLDDAKLRRERDGLFERTASLSQDLQSTQEKLKAAQVEQARQALYRRVLESEDVRVLGLGGKDPQPKARARVFWSETAKRGVVVAGQLAALPADKQYELWVFDKGKPVPAGVFDADTSGRAFFESTDLSAISAAQNFAVTIEPRGGVPAPTGPIVLVGAP